MNEREIATTPNPHASRAMCGRDVAFGIAIGIVIGASLTFALTRTMDDVVRLLRDRMQGEIREPRFELLN